MRLIHFLFYVLVTSFIEATAQDSARWASIRASNMAIGKGVEVTFTQLYGTTLTAKSEVEELSNSEIDISSLINLKYDIKFPIIIKDRTQFLAGLEYTYDYFRLDNAEVLDYEFFNIIDRKTLRSRKLKLYVSHSFNERKFMNIRGSIELNGDVNDSNDELIEFIKYSFSYVYGWQKSSFNVYGIGIYADYSLGRPSIYPVFIWNKTWNNHWGFESKLPAEFRLRYNANPGLIIYGGYDVSGISYRLFSQEQTIALLKQFEMRRSDLRLNVNFEKRLYDFLWVSIQGGLNYNIRLDVADNNRLYDDSAIIDGGLDPSPFIRVSLFIIPSENLKSFFGF